MKIIPYIFSLKNSQQGSSALGESLKKPNFKNIEVIDTIGVLTPDKIVFTQAQFLSRVGGYQYICASDTYSFSRFFSCQY